MTERVATETRLAEEVERVRALRLAGGLPEAVSSADVLGAVLLVLISRTDLSPASRAG